MTLENVTVSGDAMIGDASSGLDILEEAVDYGIAAICAEAIGHMKMLNDATVEYCRTRKQFGVPIGSFQFCSIAWSTCSWNMSSRFP